MRRKLSAARRLVIKIGSTLLVEPHAGTLRREWLSALAEEVARFHGRGQEVVIVSSGAIAVGRRRLTLGDGGLRLEEKQAAAACGQIRLAHAYEESLARHGLAVAQILLTPEDTEARRRHLNARATINQLLLLGAVPVINENDSVATSEIRFGDNDRLAARVAQMIGADTLVLLSDIDGLYSGDPRRDPAASPVPWVKTITPRIEAMAGAARPGAGAGGMVTKIAAARIATAAGCHFCIAQGRRKYPLRAIERGARCTWFAPRETPRRARKRWIAGILETAGSITIDDGARRALGRGKSLLSAGVVAVGGQFERGDAVAVIGPEGREIGRGLSAYSSADARRIAGRKSSEIEDILGYGGREELIHRDDLILD